ncbi:hypothetical protein [Paenibacillus sp. SI8]|uniref:hypothetical protein n=1 Tax=unclassified Paenibacillus TaxID=185978 RepID=UPI003465305D
MEKKFLLRMSDEKYRTLSEMANTTSLNQYINDVLDAHIIQKEGRRSRVEKIEIGEFKVKDVREAVTVTQRSWYMEILEKYNIYFFATSKIVTPMQFIYFYGDSGCSPANCISHVGKVSHIYRNVRGDDIRSLPELQALMADPLYADEIASWGEYQIVVLSEVGELVNPIPLTGNYVNHPRIIVNRTSTVVKGFAAPKMDDLF